MLPDTDPTDHAHFTVSAAHNDFLQAIEDADCPSRCIQLQERLDFLVRVLVTARQAALEKAARLQAQTAAVSCSWCGVLMREGTLPASHGMCPTCAEREHAQLDAEGVPR